MSYAQLTYMCRLPTTADSGGVYYFPDNGTLVLDRADEDSNGVYECTGTNSLGMESASTEIFFVQQSKRNYNHYLRLITFVHVREVLFTSCIPGGS